MFLSGQRVARQDVDVHRRPRSCRPPSARAAAGCSASRRRRTVTSAMRAERFGSYSMVDTVPGMSFLSRLKSITRYIALVAAAAPPRRHFAAVVAPARFLSGSVSGLCGRGLGDLVEHLDRLEPPAGRRRFVSANGHDCLSPLQEFRNLLAVLQPDVRLLPVRPAAGESALALQLPVHDASCGRSPPSSRELSTACRSRSCWRAWPPANTIVRPSSRRMVVFSVMSGRRMTSVSFMARYPAPPAAARAPRGSITVRAVHHVAGGDAAARHQPHAVQVAHRERELFVGLHVHESALPVAPRPLAVRPRPSSSPRSAASASTMATAPSLELLGEGGAQRALLDLLRQLVVVAARLRPEHRCRPCATAGSASRRRAPGRCPSAATASCRSR